MFGSSPDRRAAHDRAISHCLARASRIAVSAEAFL
jgi:hypothetical protein